MKELENILKSIKNKEFLPIYFLHGEEPYFIDVAVKHIENDILEEDEKAFNQTVVYGKDTNYGEILSLAKQYPMMGDRQVIIVKEAQDLALNEEQQEIFLKYIENPVPSTLLVFAHKHKKLDSRKKVGKALQSNKMLFLSEPFKSYGNDLSNWIQKECENIGIKTAPNISHLLAEYLGNDLSRIANELHKLKLILKDGEVLDGKLVETHIGISKDYNVFELQEALGTKNSAQAFKIVHYMGKNPKTNPLVMTIGNLYNFFSNLIVIHSMAGQTEQSIASELSMHPFVVKKTIEKSRFYSLKHATRVISILRETDLKSKGLGANQTEDHELLKEMVYKILNVDKIKVNA